MDTEILLKRHSQLWENGEKSVRRTIISGLIFAVVVLFNVLEPYSKTADRRAALRGFQEAQKTVREELESLVSVEDELGKIAAKVDQAPWTIHKKDLMDRFARGEIREPQREADETIRQITEHVRSEIIVPLENAVRGAPVSADLAAHPGRMSRAIDQWARKNIGRRWFRTIEMKDRTVLELDESVEMIQREASDSVRKLQDAVTGKQMQLELEQLNLAANVQVEESELQKALDGIMPAWSKGLVTVELMVRLYPLVLVGIAIYLVGGALLAARHYQGIADMHGWSSEERSDPVLSSLLTLTYRGPSGTAATVVCYGVVIVALWFCLTRGIEAVGGESLLAAVLWLPHVVMLVALITAIVAPFWGRRGSGLTPAA